MAFWRRISGRKATDANDSRIPTPQPAKLPVRPLVTTPSVGGISYEEYCLSVDMGVRSFLESECPKTHKEAFSAIIAEIRKSAAESYKIARPALTFDDSLVWVPAYLRSFREILEIICFPSPFLDFKESQKAQLAKHLIDAHYAHSNVWVPHLYPGKLGWTRTEWLKNNRIDENTSSYIEFLVTRCPVSHRLFEFIRDATVPVQQEIRFEHQSVLAPPGSGKTTLIEAQLAQDFELVGQGKCSVIVLDSENELLPKLAKSKRFTKGGDLEGRLVYLEPEEEHPLRLNLFDPNKITGTRDERAIARREIRDSIAMSLAAMNETQEAMLRYLADFCLSINDATIDTLIGLLKANGLKDYKGELERVDPHVRDYLQTVFQSPSRVPTRDAIHSRLFDMMSEPTFRSMVRAKGPAFNLLAEIEKGRVIIVNAKRLLLGASGCQMFGRNILGQLVHASLHRDSSSIPVFCYVDECQDYIANDDGIGQFLAKARKRNIGLIFATQDLIFIKSEMVKALLEKCAIRFIADENQRERGVFQAFIKRTTTEGAIEVRVQPPPDAGQMSDDEFAAIKQEMRERYCNRGNTSESHEPEARASQQQPFEVDDASRAQALVRQCGAALAEFWPPFEKAIRAITGEQTESRIFDAINKLDISDADKERINELRRQRNALSHEQEPFSPSEWTPEIVHYTKLFVDLAERRRADPAKASESF